MERRIYRGNFVNFMTDMTDFSIVYGSHYVLKIVENDKTYFYEVAGGQIFDLPQTTALSTSVLTDWDFLSERIQNYHLFKRDGVFFKNDTTPPYPFEINFDSKNAWADKFADLLPKDVILKLHEEVGEFEKIKFIKSYLNEINDTVYKVSEYLIDDDWYLYLGRWRLYKELFSISFEYNIKNFHTVRKENYLFFKMCHQLSEHYPIPFKFIRTILRASNCDLVLCSQALEDILNTRKIFSASTAHGITYSDKFYSDYLVTADYYGFEHFIRNFAYLYSNFKFTNRALKQQLADFMLGK